MTTTPSPKFRSGGLRRRVLLLASAVAALASCEQAEESASLRSIRQYAVQTPEAARVMGFERATDWSAGAAALSESQILAQGARALAVTSSGWTEVISIPTGPVGDVGEELSFELFLPSPEPWGTARLIVQSPNAGEWWQELPCAGAGLCQG
jgi:hypothetical protein